MKGERPQGTVLTFTLGCREVELVEAFLGLFSGSMDTGVLAALREIGGQLMSAISDFSSKVMAHQSKIDGAVSGLEADVQALKVEIAKLQTTPGPITPEDQALLDGIEARSAAIATKLEALDALTPPVAPPG